MTIGTGIATVNKFGGTPAGDALVGRLTVGGTTAGTNLAATNSLNWNQTGGGKLELQTVHVKQGNVVVTHAGTGDTLVGTDASTLSAACQRSPRTARSSVE